MKKVGFSHKDATKLKNQIFDTNEGLLSATSNEEFEFLAESLAQQYGDLFTHRYMKSFLNRVFQGPI